MLSKAALSPLLLLSSVLAAFMNNDRVCWRRNCIVQTDAGTLCFEPHDNGIEQECADNFLKNLTQVHLTSATGRSILYYDNDARVLGAATWTISPTMAGSVFVCMTGRLMDDPKQYRTICRPAQADDDMGAADAHTGECVSHKQPLYVSDGCFSIGKPSDCDNDHKEWYEQPVVAGFFWVLGVLVTLGSMYMWGGRAVRVAQFWFPRRLVAYPTAAIEQLARDWPQSVPPLPTHQSTTISQQLSAAGSVSLSSHLLQVIVAYFCYSTVLQQQALALYAFPPSPLSALSLIICFRTVCAAARPSSPVGEEATRN